MKKIFLAILFITSLTTVAQQQRSQKNKGTITGKILDKTSKQPLSYVNILLKTPEGSIQTGGITTEQGTYHINNIPAKKMVVEIQFIGYKTISKSVIFTSEKHQISLGTIFLEEDSTTLDEVEIRAETSTVVQKVDRKVINVGKDLTAAGTTASELLNNIQSVSVDSQTGALSLRGNSNVRVLIDGKPTNSSTAQVLQQIPSSSIKSVELITNPSAKYNPEGMSGIVNIILNKNATIGFNGTVDLGASHSVNTRLNGAVNMNYKTGIVNIFANYGANSGKRHNFGYITRYGTYASTQDFLFDNDNNSQLLKIGADIYLNAKNTLSVYSTQNFSNGLATGSTKISENGVLVTHAPNTSNSATIASTYNANYKLDFETKGHSLEFEVTYSNDTSTEDALNSELLTPASAIEYPIYNYTNAIDNDRSNTLVNIDYTKPIGKDGKLELGIEYRNNDTKNNNLTDQHQYTYTTDGTGDLIISGTEMVGNAHFTYNRSIQSGYFNYAQKFNKLSIQIGARLEDYKVVGVFKRTGVSATPYEDAIFSVYPSAFFTLNASEKNQFQLSYSKRVDRPSIGQVNPIREWSTPLVTSIGNPNLKPQFTNSFEFNYTRSNARGDAITFGTFYRKINDNISRHSNPDPLDPVKQLLSYANYDHTEQYGLELSGNYKVTSWWRVNSSMDFYSKKEQNLSSSITNNIFNARMSHSFTASKKLRFQLFTMYRGPGKGIQFNRKSMWMLNTGASLRVLKGKGTINLRANDIFKGMRFRFTRSIPYDQVGQFNWESQSVHLGFNYRFGGGKNKERSRKRRDSNEKQGSGGFV